MLTWNNHTPRFSNGGYLGDALLLYFGFSLVDDIEVSEFTYRIRLFRDNDLWSAKVKLSREQGYGKQPEIDLFLSELNSALEAQLDFDFSNYLGHWKKEDSGFLATVLDSSIQTWLLTE